MSRGVQSGDARPRAFLSRASSTSVRPSVRPSDSLTVRACVFALSPRNRCRNARHGTTQEPRGTIIHGRVINSSSLAEILRGPNAEAVLRSVLLSSAWLLLPLLLLFPRSSFPSSCRLKASARGCDNYQDVCYRLDRDIS